MMIKFGFIIRDCIDTLIFNWDFFYFQVLRGYTKEHHELMDLAISGHITHGSGMKSPEFKQFLDQFPPWSYPVGWTSSYKSFKF